MKKFQLMSGRLKVYPRNIMKRITILFIFCQLLIASGLAHPGIGIVKDSKGNIYYTDLKQVWKIDKSGKKTIVVKHVHTHELYIDDHDDLYGEHLWYNGEKLNTWGHYVWCLKNDGSLVNETEPTEGFLNNYSFVRDTSGNMYWVERFTISRFMKKSPDGKITKLAEGKFGFIGWLHCTADGTIYFTEKGTLKKLTTDGKVVLLAKNLDTKTSEFSMMGRNYDGYGIWTDAADNIYVAMNSEKKINRIDTGGKVTTVLSSNSLWTVYSGIFDNDGNLWLLETSVTNEVRVRKITRADLDAGVNISKSFTNSAHMITTVVIAITAVILWLLLRYSFGKRRIKQAAANLNFHQ